jgi:hypothetical protein
VDSGPYVRLQVSETLYYYPDAMVTCDESLNPEATEVWTPRLVVEVLSDSTEANDRGEMFANYQTVDSASRSICSWTRGGEQSSATAAPSTAAGSTSGIGRDMSVTAAAAPS